MAILGTIKMYIDNQSLGGRMLVEAAVIEGDAHQPAVVKKVGYSARHISIPDR